jgi:preprotein translocase subunit SecG
MYSLFAVLIIITCVLLILIIMVQNPKGGGLSSAFGGGNQIMGARKTSDFLEKTTWGLAMILVTLALVSNFAIPRSNAQETIIDNVRDSDIEDNNEMFDINIEDELDNSDNNN